MTESVVIQAFGGYLPRLRLSRQEVAAAHAWVNPGLAALAEGERTTASWDEDVITMGVDAARECLAGVDRQQVEAIFLASTTAPFADRLNSGVVAGALGLAEETKAYDVGGSLRAGLTALTLAADVATARHRPALVVAAERRRAPAASTAELTSGHGAAALLIGTGDGVARLLGASSLTLDFVDHYRSEGQEFDYQWEERWIRDEGYLKIVPRAVKAALASAQVAPSEVTRFCLASPIAGASARVAAALGVPTQARSDDLMANCGHAGVAHPSLMLVRALECADPGDRIVVAGFGQGADALVFEVTDRIGEYRRRRTSLSTWIARRSHCTYPRYLALNDLIQVDRGIRAEVDKGTALTAMYRHRDLINGLVGGQCTRCGTHQIPRLRICVNPECRELDSQLPYSFAESRARVVSWSADNLTFTPDPPAYYGMVDFEEGGRLMVDFTNVDDRGVEVGTQMRMVFRIKDQDRVRGFTRYFWKAAPAADAEEG